MRYKVKESLSDVAFLPASLDDYVGQEHICRAIALFVESLDLKSIGFANVEPKQYGNRPYNPQDMLKLYLYGYLNRITSSRRLEKETYRNVEVMWLLGKLTPENRTICYFRSANSKVLKKVFLAFSRLCNQLDLYGRELIAVDGTKVRANNGLSNIYKQHSVEKQITEYERKINEYMNACDENDKNEKDEVKAQVIIEALTQKKGKLQAILNEMKEKQVDEIATVDADCRIMKNGRLKYNEPCYNVQAVTDSKNKLIVDFETTQCSADYGYLHSMTESAKEIMGVTEINAVADKGYFSGKDLAKCESSGTTCYVANSEKESNGKFSRDEFKYNKESDTYLCPNKCVLSLHGTETRKEVTYSSYSNAQACKNCPIKSKCTSAKFREFVVSQYDEISKIVKTRTKQNYAIYKKRSQIIEHQFGTTKVNWGNRQYLTRGKEKVVGEQSLIYLAYNFLRVFNILGVKLLKELKQMRQKALVKLTFFVFYCHNYKKATYN